MNIVIAGCGRLGSYLARMLAQHGHRVTVVDQDSQSFRRLGSDFPGEVVVGVCIDEDVLQRAGIEQAEAFIAVTSSDAMNVMAAQVAQAFGVPHVVCRIQDPQTEEAYRNLGMTTVSATVLAAQAVFDALQPQATK